MPESFETQEPKMVQPTETLAVERETFVKRLRELEQKRRAQNESLKLLRESFELEQARLSSESGALLDEEYRIVTQLGYENLSQALEDNSTEH